MPGMDGLEMVRRARRTPSFASIPVIATSASVLEHERQEFLAAGFDDFIDKPFHLGKICACLARRLGVEFERRQPASPAPEPDVDWKTVRVPPQMHGPMREAAELYSVTELERYCRELDGLGPDQQRLARRLRDLSRRHDMQAIIDALEEVQVG